jgi:hypothetical protein
MRLIILFCLLLFSKLIFSQKTIDFITLEKTPCFGRCPVYTLTLKGSGDVFLKVDTNLALSRGCYEGKIDIQKTKEIFNTYKTQKIFSFKNEYLGKMTDIPTTHITFKMGKKIKKIKDQYGAPTELKNLEGLMVNLLSEIDDWKKVDSK